MPDNQEIHEIVRRVVGEVLGDSVGSPAAPSGTAAQPSGSQAERSTTSPPRPAAASPGGRSGASPAAAGGGAHPGPVAIGADHGGYPLKEVLKAHLESAGYTVIDCGTHSTDSVDYPDFARAVAVLVGEGKAWRGIMIDGAGIGSCMAANKVPGVRASMCYDHATAHNAREHNDANVLTLGAGLIGQSLAKQIVDTWLETEFGGGRHGRRVDKIMDIEG